jgi:hypothetical protein
MQELGLRSKLSKKFKVTANSKHKYFIVLHVLKRESSVTEPSSSVSDINYLRVKEQFLFNNRFRWL